MEASDSNGVAPEIMTLIATIISAFVSRNELPADQLPQLIRDVSQTVIGLAHNSPGPSQQREPAVAAKKSLFPDHLICLEDGMKMKTLKRHLMSNHQLTPEQYRQRWGLPHDYPMVAPNYTKARSALAKKMGLGKHPAAKKAARKLLTKKKAA